MSFVLSQPTRDHLSLFENNQMLGPLFYIESNRWMNLEILQERFTDFKVRWMKDREKELEYYKAVQEERNKEKKSDKQTRQRLDELAMTEKILSIEIMNPDISPLSELHPAVVSSKTEDFSYSNKIFLDLLKTLHNAHYSAEPPQLSSQPEKVLQDELQLKVWVLRKPTRRNLQFLDWCVSQQQ